MVSIPPSPPPIKRLNVQQGKLSFSQESLWFLQLLDPENIAYNTNSLIKFTGGLDPSSMEKAINEMVHRHAPLRTIYPNRGGKPLQIVQPYEPFPLPLIDISHLPDAEKYQAVQKHAAEFARQPYDLQKGPIMRCTLLHEGTQVDTLFFSIHHISYDAWSQNTFFSELMQLYDAFRNGRQPDLPALPVEYLDHALWQREWLAGDTLQAYIDHWKTILSGDLPILELPIDHPRPSMQSFQGTRHGFSFSPGLVSRMRDFCRRERLTVYQVLIAAYAVLLMRHSGQEDIIIGCPFANRSRPEQDPLVGFFVNTLPIRLNLQGDPTVRELLQQVRRVMLDAFTWQAAPFEALVSEISPQRDLSRTPVFQTMLNLRNVPRRSASVEGLEMELVQRESGSQFDIYVDFGIGDDEELEGAITYCTDLYDENTILHLLAHFQNLLDEILSKTDRPISDLQMLTPSEWQRIVKDWNETTEEFPQVCLHDLFTTQVDKTPDALAVHCNGTSLTYRQVDEMSNQLAHYLRQRGVEAESRVGLYLPRSEKIVVALLAILKAGGAYVPLDITYPPERLAYMIQDSSPAVIITVSSLEKDLPGDIRKVCLDGEASQIEDCAKSRPSSISGSDALVYILYTSGSTGRPKGAMNIHRGVVNYLIGYSERNHISASDRNIALTSLNFDVSVAEIFGTLSYGGMIFLMDDGKMRDPQTIINSIVTHHITRINVVPTMLRAICEAVLIEKHGAPSLQLITSAGEALLASDVELVRRAFGKTVLLVNEYGPTECSIIATYYVVPIEYPYDHQIVPIGKPISNARTYVLDAHQNPVPVGVKGELYIGGVGVGRGYWNQPDLTAERFLPDPFNPGGRMYRSGDIVRQLPDGTICFLGRSDEQVKIRGYRVELSEIEAVISEFPGIGEVAVVLWRQEDADILAAYITTSLLDRERVVKDLQAFLEERLPFYMLPASIMVLEQMPLSPNRKLDRGALPHPSSRVGDGEKVPPRNRMEARMVSIWKEVLGVKEVGIRDNFFELGGHSLMAIRLFMRIEEEFKQSLPLLLLFREGTVEALVAALNQQEDISHPEGAIPIQVEGSKPPFFCFSPTVIDVVTYRQLSSAMGADQPFYALYARRLPPQADGKPYDPLPFLFEEIRRVQPSGPYYLGGYSRGGWQALQVAGQLQAEGEVVELVVLLDTFAPNHPERLPWVSPWMMNFLQVMRRVQSYLWKFWVLGGKGRRDLLLSGERPLGSRFVDWINQRRKELILPVRRKPIESSLEEEMAQYREYTGRVLLLRARKTFPGTRAHPSLGWADILTCPLEVEHIPGEHEAILFGPRIPNVARILTTHLERAYQAPTSSRGGEKE